MEPKGEQKVIDSEDFDAIAASAYAELDGNGNDLSGTPKKKDEESAEPVEQTAEDASQPSDEKEGEQVADPDKTEEKPEEAKVEEVKETEAKPIDEPITEAQVNDYAIKHGMTPAEAKADIEATRAVLKNYKSPEEIARALRSTQSAYDKLKSQGEKKPAVQAFVPESDEQVLANAKAHFTKEQDKHVDAYRQRFPAKSELMTDEAIIEELVYNSLAGYKVWAKEKQSEVVGIASKRKEEILSKIAEDDRKWLPGIKAILDKAEPHRILDDTFDVEDLLRHARGEKTSYLAAIKEAEDRGYKRGLEKPTILGVKEGGKGGSSSIGRGKGSLNTAQQARAAEMFPDLEAEEAHKAFKEIYEEDLKKNPNFVS